MKKINKFGFSLAEISLAVLIFAICAIPLYYAISFGSTEEIHLDKLAIANKVLESFRDEIKNLDFDTASTYVNISGSNGLPPTSFKEFYEAQKKYKDYQFKATGSHEGKGSKEDIERIEYTATISWTRNTGKKSEQSISFVKVK